MLPVDRERDPSDLGSGSTTDDRGGRNGKVQPREGCNGQVGAREVAARSLPIAGYLYKDKVDIKDIIDPKGLGLMVLQAWRNGGMAKFYSPEKYTEQVQTMRK